MKGKKLIWIIPISLMIGFLIGISFMDVDIDLSMDNNTLEASKNMVNITNNMERTTQCHSELSKDRYIEYLENDIEKRERQIVEYKYCVKESYKDNNNWLCTNNEEYSWIDESNHEQRSS